MAQKWPPILTQDCKGQIDKNLTLNFLLVQNGWLAWNVQKRIFVPFNAIIGIEMQRESKTCQDCWIHFSSWPSLSGHVNNFCINSLQKRCPHSRVLLVELSQDLLSQHIILIQPFWSFLGVNGQNFWTTLHSQLKLNLNLDVQ